MAEPDISLRTPTTADAAALFRLVDTNREQIKKWLPWVDRTVTVADEVDFITMILDQQEQGKSWSAVICYRGQICGMIDLHAINAESRRGEVGYWQHSDFYGKGIMTEALRQVEVYAFEELKLNKLMLLAAVENKGSNRVAQRRGFFLEGLLRQHMFCAGKFQDANVYGLLASEYSANKNRD